MRGQWRGGRGRWWREAAGAVQHGESGAPTPRLSVGSVPLPAQRGFPPGLWAGCPQSRHCLLVPDLRGCWAGWGVLSCSCAGWKPSSVVAGSGSRTSV